MAARRSSRLASADLNGRGYLSDQLGCTVTEVDRWITSDQVHSHLVIWYQQNVLKQESRSVMLDLIKTRNFEKPNNIFEADILRVTLGQTRRPDMRQDAPYVSAIHSWAATTQDIVEASRLYTISFARLATDHHERFHIITIDLLCLAFHSIAYRGQGSIYTTMIGPSAKIKQCEPLILSLIHI